MSYDNKILNNRYERLRWLEKSGYTATLDGKVYNPSGEEVGTNVGLGGYKVILMPRTFDKNRKSVKVHQYVYYFYTNKVPKMIDHNNGKRGDNSLINLSDSNDSHNQRNKFSTGCSYKKSNDAWESKIALYTYIKLTTYLGLFETQFEGHCIYITAKYLRDNNLISYPINNEEFRILVYSKTYSTILNRDLL